MKIKKISNTVGLVGNIVSDINAKTEVKDYVNQKNKIVTSIDANGWK